jgi:hypothetical protein
MNVLRYRYRLEETSCRRCWFYRPRLLTGHCSSNSSDDHGPVRPSPSESWATGYIQITPGGG